MASLVKDSHLFEITTEVQAYVYREYNAFLSPSDATTVAKAYCNGTQLAYAPDLLKEALAWIRWKKSNEGTGDELG